MLARTDGDREPGIYEREDGSERPKTSTWSATVSLESSPTGSALWVRGGATGSETGLPGEVQSITLDAAGETLEMTVDTDTSLPTGPGDLTFEIAEVGGDYRFTTRLVQQSFVAALDPEIVFRGTVQPGIVAGKAYVFRLTLESNDNAYFTPTGSVWVRVAVRGQAGEDGDDGYSPVFAVKEDGARRVLQVVDWLVSTGATEPGYSTFRGTWDAGVTYDQGDYVFDNGVFYFSLTSVQHRQRGDRHQHTGHPVEAEAAEAAEAWDPKDPVDPKAHKVTLAPPAPPDPKAPWATLGVTVPTAPPEPPASAAPRATRATRETPAKTVRREPLVLKATLAPPVRLAHRVTPAPQARQARTVPTVTTATRPSPR